MNSPFPYTIHLNSDEPIIFIHPFPANDAIWENQLALPYSVITVDLTRAKINDMEMIAEGIVDIFVTERIEQATICGCSLGGYVAYTIAKYFPNRVKSLIMTDTRAANDNDVQRANRLTAIANLKTNGISAVSGAAYNLVGETTRNNNTALVEKLTAGIATLSAEGLIALQEAILGREDFTSFLPQINVPVTYICGAEDTVSPPEILKKMAEKTPDSLFYLVDSAGHLPCIENPAAFNEIVTNHMDRLISG